MDKYAILIGISGGTGSGKTSIATLLVGLFLLVAGAALLILTLSTGRHQAESKAPADQIDSAGDR